MNGGVSVLLWIMYVRISRCVIPGWRLFLYLVLGHAGTLHCTPLVLSVLCFRSRSIFWGLGCSKYRNARISRRAALRWGSWSNAAVLSIIKCILGSQYLGLHYCSKREEEACWGRIFFAVLICCLWLSHLKDKCFLLEPDMNATKKSPVSQ